MPGNPCSVFADVGSTISQDWLSVYFRFHAAAMPVDHTAYVDDAVERGSMGIRVGRSSVCGHDCEFGVDGRQGSTFFQWFICGHGDVRGDCCLPCCAYSESHCGQVESAWIARVRDGRHLCPSLPLDQSAYADPESLGVLQCIESCCPLHPIQLRIIPEPTGHDKQVLEVDRIVCI